MKLKLSTSARLTLANTALLALSFGLLLLFIIWLADRFMVSHVEESVHSELHILQAEEYIDGGRGVEALIDQRLRNSTPNHDRLYRLESPKGLMLAGNVEAWPAVTPEAEQVFRLPSRKYPGQTRVVAEWIRLADGSRLLVGYDEIEIAQVRGDIRRAALWSLGAMLLISLTAGLLLTRAALRPVEAIRAAAQKIMAGDLRHRVPARAHGDEFDRLGETLNAMLDRINALIASVRGATDNIAHDLRSPLTRHRSRLEAALANPPTAAELPAWIERNLADLDQVLATFQSLLRIATVESGLLRQEFEACDLTQLAQDAADYLEPLAEEKQQRLQLDLLPGPPLRGHRHLLFQMLVNLLDNAVKYSPAGGLIKLSARPEAQAWVLEVSDAGPGIPASERERVFERLVRLDASRHEPGLGLGLSLARAIVDLHQGQVAVLEQQPGARVRVRLPLVG